MSTGRASRGVNQSTVSRGGWREGESPAGTETKSNRRGFFRRRQSFLHFPIADKIPSFPKSRRNHSPSSSKRVCAINSPSLLFCSMAQPCPRRFLSKNIPTCLSLSSSFCVGITVTSFTMRLPRALNPNENPAQFGIFFSANRLNRKAGKAGIHRRIAGILPPTAWGIHPDRGRLLKKRRVVHRFLYNGI
ncbi:MAG: hypothetical protein BECKG1743D_GA0114223_101048 [Candidatus Kentron sp. G]|nr:MAG: hypothetical protein BECKG1743D_GA0114223_101048 [Candidatus Kentron sp. G]VFN02586.1 MAG: hypothetical protein BECKG1743E_GA0114224_105211 [Candidatus Kentron sp. G]VFN06391.1 MAG: hypothetical protein BECKG1743F_GA0114225_112241 [Candidatus Kentron sp. G]